MLELTLHATVAGLLATVLLLWGLDTGHDLLGIIAFLAVILAGFWEMRRPYHSWWR